jgi:hypothetical protein
MQLRDHPLMAYHAIRNWPPVWIKKYADSETMIGEIGVLTHVGSDSLVNRCYLHITYNEKPYVGSLLFDDVASCAFVRALLQQHVNETIERIGVIDVSYTV